MHRIDTKGSKRGLFTEAIRHEDGTEEATIISADWLNDVQENLCYVIERANVTLNKHASDQLFHSILAMIENALTPIKRSIEEHKETLKGLQMRIEKVEKECGIK